MSKQNKSEKEQKINQALAKVEQILQPLIDEYGENAFSNHAYEIPDKIYQSQVFSALHLMYNVAIPDYKRKRLNFHSSMRNASDEVIQELHFVLNMAAIGDTDTNIQKAAAVLLGDLGDEMIERAAGYRNDIAQLNKQDAA